MFRQLPGWIRKPLMVVVEIAVALTVSSDINEKLKHDDCREQIEELQHAEAFSLSPAADVLLRIII